MPARGVALEDLPDAQEVQLDREALARGGGEELGGRLDEGAVRSAHQRLEANDAPVAEAEDGLEDGREAPLLQHPMKLEGSIVPNRPDLRPHSSIIGRRAP